MSRSAVANARSAVPVGHTGSLFVVRGLAGLLVFLGLTATGGGVAMLGELRGGANLPARWLDELPLIDTFLIPAVVLIAGFGAGSLVTAYGVLRRPRWRIPRAVERRTRYHWSWTATQVLGAGMIVWIGLELVYLPDLSWLEAVYGLTGLALVLLPWTPAVRDHLRVRVAHTDI
ncbi:MAG: hypothetical protein HOU01_26710 [Streptomycetaceae bacterium]|nr:hypothetical protein [Streptomycetaceae bacterium]